VLVMSPVAPCVMVVTSAGGGIIAVATIVCNLLDQVLLAHGSRARVKRLTDDCWDSRGRNKEAGEKSLEPHDCSLGLVL